MFEAGKKIFCFINKTPILLNTVLAEIMNFVKNLQNPFNAVKDAVVSRAKRTAEGVVSNATAMGSKIIENKSPAQSTPTGTQDSTTPADSSSVVTNMAFQSAIQSLRNAYKLPYIYIPFNFIFPILLIILLGFSVLFPSYVLTWFVYAFVFINFIPMVLFFDDYEKGSILSFALLIMMLRTQLFSYHKIRSIRERGIQFGFAVTLLAFFYFHGWITTLLTWKYYAILLMVAALIYFSLSS